jgi:nucleoside-diphosphate-sugar epimerase
VRELFARDTYDVVLHCAAQLAHGGVSPESLWSSNVEATQLLASIVRERRVPKVIFTSSNCLWCQAASHPIREDEEPCPCEPYGRSKWEAEKVLLAADQHFDTVVLRGPTIIDEGRLGLLAMLFEFIDEGRVVWMVGGGRNRYQFIYAQDLATAFLAAAEMPGSAVFHIGSDDVKTMAEVFQHVIDRAGSASRLVAVPKRPAILAMQLAHAVGLSPLGPYQYRMIAEDFLFDTSRIQATLGWRPTLTNEEMLSRAYVYYREHRAEIESRGAASAHRTATPMGIIRLLKFFS